MAYILKTWVTGETIDASELNHMEQGIATAQSTADGAASSVNALSANGAIGTDNLADGAVTSEKIATAAVGGTQIASETITAENIADETLTEAKLDPTFAADIAKVDGSYEGMTVGNAEQLVSTVGVEDSAPYTFRPTGGSADVGDRMNLKAVIGGTVAWNQLVSNGNFSDSTGWSGRYASVSVSGNVATITPTSSGTDRGLLASTTEPSVIANHVYLLRIDCKPSGAFGLNLTISGGASYAAHHPISMIANVWNTCATMWKTSNVGSYTTKLYALVNDSLTTSDGIQFRNANVFDLTAMFGSAIADYVYTLESGTAGAGVAWLKKCGYFTKPYYPYKAAALESVKTSAHKTIEFNQWDEEWELATINWTTYVFTPSATGGRLIPKNYIRVVPGAVYCAKLDRSITVIAGYTDDNGSGGRNIPIAVDTNLFTIPNDVNYIKFGVSTATYGTTYKNDICINLHWDGEMDGQYAPFEQHTYALDDVELRGILKLDAFNNLYADGDRYLPDGTVERRYGVVDLSTLTWTDSGAYYTGQSVLPNVKTPANGGVAANAICSSCVVTASNNVSGGTVNGIGIRPNGSLCATDNGASPTGYLVYELATPTTETADPYTELQICNDFGTEEFVDAATRDFDMPVGHNTVYQPNLRAKLEMAPNSPDGDGDYLVRQTNGVNEYVLFSEVKELPDMPTTDGNYKLRCTVSGGTATLTWVSE